MSAKLSVHSSTKKEDKQYSFKTNVIKIGSLETNEVVFSGKEIEPIHALLYFHDTKWTLENISGAENLFYNKRKVVSSCDVSPKGEIEISGNRILLDALENLHKEGVEAEKPEGTNFSGKDKRRRQDLLFSPRKGQSTGNVLEVVSYWDDRILGVEHFGEKGDKDKGSIFIGSSEEAHFATSNVKPRQNLYKFCDYTQESLTLYLVEGMTARVRKGGAYISLGAGEHTLKRGDVAHVKYFSTRFLFVHKTLPAVHVPRETLEDPLFAGLLVFFLVSYTFLCSSFYLVGVPEKEDHNEALWAEVEKVQEFKPEKVDLKKVKKEKEIKKPKPVEKEVVEKKKTEPKKPKPKKDPFKEMKKLNKSLVVSKTKVKAAKKTVKVGAKRKGKDKTDQMGVEKAKAKKTSGLNLSVVGLGLGDVKSHGGLGAIPVKLNKESGGAGLGAGSAKKTFGLGGVGEDLSKSDLLALNTDGANFGDASESLTGGDLGSQFEREGSADLQIHSADPLIGIGIDKKAVWDVLMSAQRAINHCYNTLLQRERSAQGTVTLSIVVNTAGKAPDSKVEKSDIKDTVMQECILNVIRRLTFPKPEGTDEVEFKMPYGFSPE